MKPIISSLKPQMRGPNVAGLHEALTLLGLMIGAERTAQRCGASKQFQTAQQLPTTDGVDEATAKAINAVLAEKGGFDLPSGGGDLPPSNPSPRTRLLL